MERHNAIVDPRAEIPGRFGRETYDKLGNWLLCPRELIAGNDNKCHPGLLGHAHPPLASLFRNPRPSHSRGHGPCMMGLQPRNGESL